MISDGEATVTPPRFRIRCANNPTFSAVLYATSSTELSHSHVISTRRAAQSRYPAPAAAAASDMAF
eukprot:922200-Pyramimonas_sp.AAC.1